MKGCTFAQAFSRKGDGWVTGPLGCFFWGGGGGWGGGGNKITFPVQILNHFKIFPLLFFRIWFRCSCCDSCCWRRPGCTEGRERVCEVWYTFSCSGWNSQSGWYPCVCSQQLRMREASQNPCSSESKASNSLLLNSSPGTKRIAVKWSLLLMLVLFLPTLSRLDLMLSVFRRCLGWTSQRVLSIIPDRSVRDQLD